MIENFTLYTKMLEIITWLYRKMAFFPKRQRFVLGQQIENSALCALRAIIEANNAHGTASTLERLDELNCELDVLRGYLRVACELTFISMQSLSFITEQIDEVGRIRGGWIKTLQHKDGTRSNKHTP